MLTMFDDIDANAEPSGDAQAGYINGIWANYWEVKARFPNKPVLSITVNAAGDADCLDIENGDATADQAPAWVRRQQARGVHRPCLYTSVSNVATLMRYLTAAGIQRAEVRLWVAHYNNVAHICSPSCGDGTPVTADGTQWRSTNSYDESLLLDDFFASAPAAPSAPAPAPAAPAPTPTHSQEEYMKLVTATNPSTGKAAQYLIRSTDVLHVPDGICSAFAYKEFNGGQGELEAVEWEVILWLNKGQVPA